MQGHVHRLVQRRPRRLQGLPQEHRLRRPAGRPGRRPPGHGPRHARSRSPRQGPRLRPRIRHPRAAGHRPGNHHASRTSPPCRTTAAARARSAASNSSTFNSQLLTNYGSLYRSSRSHQPPLRRADLWPLQVPRAPQLRPGRARPQVPPQAHRLRPRPDREAEAALLLRPAGAPVPRRLRARPQAPRRHRRTDAPDPGDAPGQRRAITSASPTPAPPPARWSPTATSR